MTRLMTTATQRYAGTATLAQRSLADLAESGLAAVPVLALEPSNSDHTRDVLGQRDADSTIAITQLGEALVHAVGDRMDLTLGNIR